MIEGSNLMPYTFMSYVHADKVCVVVWLFL